jgi:hypothetical protein
VPQAEQAYILAHLGSLIRDNPFRTTEHQVILPNGDIR